MKTRSDFVSNSSSSSFVIRQDNGCLARALDLWTENFAGVEIPFHAEDVRVHINAKNKDINSVQRAISHALCEEPDRADNERLSYAEESPDDISYNPVSISISELSEMWNKLKSSPVVDKIVEMSFDAYDDDFMSTLYLRMLYLFFDRNKCSPDASVSEHDFLSDDSSENKFLSKLCYAGGEADGL